MLFLIYIGILTFALFISVYDSKLRITDMNEELQTAVKTEKSTDFFSEKRSGRTFPHMSQEL
jgi:hypothetical protein